MSISAASGVPSALRAVVSDHVGLVPRVDECLAGTGDGRFPSCVCEPATDQRLLGSSLAHFDSASGAGMTIAAATTAALGEAVERYSASFVPAGRLVHATAAELGSEAVAPGRFALFAERQYASPGFPFRPFDDGVSVPWVRGWALRDGAPAWLPAELVFLGDIRDPGRIGYATSTGAACAARVDEAVLRGLFELLERDAFMIVWRSRLSPPLLEWRRQTKLRVLDDRHFAPTGLRYSALDLSFVHDLPCVLGVVRSLDGPIGVGAGTAATVARAWWKALAEAFAAHGAARRLAVLDERPPQPENVHTFDDHIRFFAFGETATAADFLDASAARVDSRDVPALEGDDAAARIAALLDRVERAGSSAYAVDVTSPDVGRLGLRVIKTLAPELCPLDASHRARFLGGERLRHAAYQLGLRPRPLRVDELNPDPHPFP